MRRIGGTEASSRTMSYIVTASLFLVGVIHLLPAIGMVSAGRVGSLYGIEVAEPNLELLLRHRAVLFAWLGGFCVLAAFLPRLQATALVAASVSVLSFLWLAVSIGGLNAALTRVFRVDLLAALLLLAAAWACLWRPAHTG